MDKPAGSFKCDRLVRSSLASSIAGFISGGRLGLLSSRSSAWVVSSVLDCSREDYQFIKQLSDEIVMDTPLHFLAQRQAALYHSRSTSP